MARKSKIDIPIPSESEMETIGILHSLHQAIDILRSPAWDGLRKEILDAPSDQAEKFAQFIADALDIR